MTLKELKEMIEKMEETRQVSKDGCIYYAMCNGKEVVRTGYPDTKQYLEDNGYWVCAIFQNGHRVES